MTARYLVRPPSPAFRHALSEHAERERIDPARAVQQHAAFVAALRQAGADIIELPSEADLPDATFVSDCLVVLPSASGPVAIVTRPGAPSRRGEVESVAEAARMLLRGARRAAITEPGTLEGGDLVILGTTVAIGLSERTNEAGARQFAAAVASAGYSARLCPVRDRLHLASEVTAIGPRRLVGTARGFDSLDRSEPLGSDDIWLAGVERILVPDDEVPASNVLAVGGTCIVAAGNPRTAAALRATGAAVIEVDLSEFTRADGGPTCLVAALD